MSSACVHLDRIPDAENNYKIVLAYYVTCTAEGFNRKATEANCHCCKSSYRIHACLECAFFGCVDRGNGGVNHMQDHAVKNEHFCAVNINHGCLFCFACGDYIYNEAFEKILHDNNLEAFKVFDYQRVFPWKPKKEEIDQLFKGKVKVRRIAEDSYIGLRGVLNIGNSCYVNCVIQVLIHNPVLREFFLSDKHRCCLPKDVTCLMCEMFVLFQQFYSGFSSPYDASKRFNEVLMKCCGLIAGVYQSDCCELYQKILAGMHASCQPHQISNCDCVIHQMFYGTNETLKVCLDCRTESLLPLDDFTNIMLDLDGKDDFLLNILNRKYLEPQLLSEHPCSECGKTDTTQLFSTITKLPTVICFQVNCFSFTEQKSTSRSKDPKKEKIVKPEKKNVCLAFDHTIDMSPYLKPKYLSNGKDSLGIENRYSLFAAIVHKGELDDGHYVVYVRNRGNRWYLCNDGLIYSQNLEEVLNCQPSLLFYSKLL